MIESLVAVLLLLTIVYCVVLNSALKRLKADELALKATISELITATEIAERAIAGLKMTVRDCDQNLSERLRDGRALLRRARRPARGRQDVLDQLAQIAAPGRGARRRAGEPKPDRRARRPGDRRGGAGASRSARAARGVDGVALA